MNRHAPNLARHAAAPRRAAAISDRLRQRVRDRGAARRTAGRPQLAAALRLRALRRAAQRLAVHRAAHHQRALLALPHPADRRALGHVPTRPTPACGAPRRAPRSSCRSRRCAGTRSRCPTRAVSFVEGVRTITTAGDAGQPGRHGRACLSRHPLDAGRVFLQRRRRDAVRAAAGRAAPLRPSSASSTSSPARSRSFRAA